MEEIKEDPRFAHIATDPRFRSMPKSKRKIKIDSRFRSLLTNPNFSHKTNIDKRGRPVIDLSKKNKHVMERFYELSDSDMQSDSDNINDELEKKKSPAMDLSKSTKKNSKFESFGSKQEDGSSVKKKRKLKELDTQFSKNKKAKILEITENNKAKEKSESEDSDENEQNTKTPLNENDENSEIESKAASDDESEEDEDDELPAFTEEYALEETEVDHKWNELNADAPPVSDSTYRLAVCNMDWDFVKAQDLYVLFKSFVPGGGRVKSVAIYPSEFGKERMKEEAMLGPREIREGLTIDDKEAGDDTNVGGKNKKNVKDQKKIKQSKKEKEAFQTERLREYQLNRLKYYYAVVDCDSVSTADAIYTECDGREYQLSSVRLDLRFIPDDMTFDDEPKDMFSEEQSIAGYQPSKFNSTALSQAKVEVTWDETEFDRLSRRVAQMQKKELESLVEENKYSDIIAAPESDSEEEEDGRPAWLLAVLSETNEEENKNLTEEEKIQLYRKVLMDKLAEDEAEKKEEEGEMDKEMVWQPGLRDKVQKKMKKKEKQVDNVIVNEFLEKKKEKKKKKREEKKVKQKTAENGEEQAFSDDELPAGVEMGSLKELLEEEGATTKSKKNKKKNKKKDKPVNETEEKAKAELELMLMDETSNTKKLSKPKLLEDESKRKKKKKAKLLKQAAEEENSEDFKLDFDDSRFGALYTSPSFHIDPTAPQFKKTKNMMRLVDEQIKRKKKPEKQRSAQLQSSNVENKSFSDALFESLKRKMKK